MALINAPTASTILRASHLFAGTVGNIGAIARGSTLRYAGQTIDVRDVAREIGARYVMEGSGRQARRQAATGTPLWAETYNRPFQPDAILEVQDDLVPRIVSTIADMVPPPPGS
ncbi:MAG TPA: hypothetical protein VFT24_05885 [Vicinamibacterales bacterium]|nr:hypothetical protein [Vicinamibacterales bacterium]